MNISFSVPPDAVILNPITGEPALFGDRDNPTATPKTQTVSFATWVRMNCNFLMREAKEPYALDDLIAQLSGPRGAPVTAGTSITVNDADPYFVRLRALSRNPLEVCGAENVGVWVASYRPFMVALMTPPAAV
jgi:hypothetical protein